MAKRFLTPPKIVNLSSDPLSGSSGELYFNTESLTLKVYDGDSWSDIGGGSVFVSDSPPSNPSEGDQWFDSSTLDMYIYYDSFWVQVGGGGGASGESENIPDTLVQRDSLGSFDITSIGFEADPALSSSALSLIDAGDLLWNYEEGTLNLGMKSEVIQSIGMEFYMPPTKNNSGELIPNGSFVMATGVQGDRITIAKAVTNGSVDPMYMIGIATEDIPNGSEDGLVTTNGIVRGLNTNSWNVGDILYPNPSVAGELINEKPNSPNIRTAIAIVLRKNANAGWIYVRMTNGSTLGGTDSNVLFTDLQDNQVVTYDAAVGIWKNADPQGGSGGGNVQTDTYLSNSWWLGV